MKKQYSQKRTTNASSSLIEYYYLTKPGIVRGNLLTVATGFLLASNGSVDLRRLLAVLFASSLVLASGCVFNNVLDRQIDSKMSRTKARAVVGGRVEIRSALIFATVLFFGGIGLIVAFVNSLVAFLGVFGVVFYVLVYGYFKRTSVHGTLIGSISGAIPPVIGYTSVTSSLDIACLSIFMILVCWQMPHFYAIAIFRAKDYKAASIPVLPLVKGVDATKRQMILYLFMFVPVCLSIWLQGYVGVVYGLIMAIAGIYWLMVGLRGWHNMDSVKWSQQIFTTSLIILPVWLIAVGLDGFITS